MVLSGGFHWCESSAMVAFRKERLGLSPLIQLFAQTLQNTKSLTALPQNQHTMLL